MGVLEDKLKRLPTNPGVYVMLNSDGQVIYVGKAKNLKNRVRQYFFNSVKTDKVMAMVNAVADFYYYIVPTEIDALSLENNLIKKYKPRYNILLKDDKTYPYIRVDLKQQFPTFTITRRLKKDGAKYFGPFMGGVNARDTLDLLNLLYKIRPCDKKFGVAPTKPCLNYHLKKCLAPCAFKETFNEYQKNVKDAVDFLSGNILDAERILTAKMTESAEKEDFEVALKYRERLLSLEKIKQKRITSLSKDLNADVIAIASDGIYSVINLLIVRNGRTLGGKNYTFNSAVEESQTLEEFVTRYYSITSDIPDEIICSNEILEKDLLVQFIKKTYNKTTQIITPTKGDKKQLLSVANLNAEEYLKTAVEEIKHKEDMTVKACEALKEKLGLKKVPYRMECFDISNISGVDKVGSMVVFIGGKKSADDYRRFRIKTVEGADDYASHAEMMDRRLSRLLQDDEKFSKPDLIIVDGGKGQLSSVNEVFVKYGITDIDLIALAEREEEIFTLNSKEPIILEKRDYCLKLLQRIRDEAHRFAITYFRSLHGKNSLTSVLDGISGIGKKRKQALILKFGDLGGIISATKEDLMTIEGIGEKQADLIIEGLKKENLR